MRPQGGECSFVDAEVRDRDTAGADTAAPSVGGDGGAPAGVGVGKESDGGGF